MKKTALVTGGAIRIGAEISRVLARNGYRVAVHYRTSKAAADQLASEVTELGGEVTCFQADLNNKDDALGLVPRVIDQMGRLDVLINSASIFNKISPQDVSLDEWESHLQINLTAPWILAQQFVSLAKTGQIINITDAAIGKYDPEFLAYGVSKWGLDALTKLMAQGFGPNFRVNAVAPGWILPSAHSGDKPKKAPGALGRIGTVQDISEAVLYLLNADFVTGVTLPVDGGLSISG